MCLRLSSVFRGDISVESSITLQCVCSSVCCSVCCSVYLRACTCVGGGYEHIKLDHDAVCATVYVEVCVEVCVAVCVAVRVAMRVAVCVAMHVVVCI